jgi:hypothetical protein
MNQRLDYDPVDSLCVLVAVSESRRPSQFILLALNGVEQDSTLFGLVVG